jgi:hypothetical protein
MLFHPGRMRINHALWDMISRVDLGKKCSLRNHSWATLAVRKPTDERDERHHFLKQCKVRQLNRRESVETQISKASSEECFPGWGVD